MRIVEVQNLNKKYPAFHLNNVSFDINESEITGFIGKNGAGKTTTIKSMLNIIHPDSGEIRYFGQSLTANEASIKELIGYTTGVVSWYPRKRIREIVNVTRNFYSNWNDDAYQYYLKYFELDDNKCTNELSDGMKVKANLLIALSHEAKVLILDEPTSGLDPFSRNELLSIFTKLKQDGIAILFSTHIISDLEKAADKIIYISKGEIIASMAKEDFIKHYSLANETLEDTILRMERGVSNA